MVSYPMARFCPGCGRRSFGKVPTGWVCSACVEATPNVRAACEVMSRFLVWVWLEAEANWNSFTGAHDFTVRDPAYTPNMGRRRRSLIVTALVLGRLRLEWAR
jgi:hypothetical protein